MSIDLIAGPVAAQRLLEIGNVGFPGVSPVLYKAFAGELARSIGKWPQLNAEGFYKRAFEILRPAFTGEDSILEYSGLNAISAQGIRENLPKIAEYAADSKAFGVQVARVYEAANEKMFDKILPDD